MRIIRLLTTADPVFPVLCAWYGAWLGEVNGETAEETAQTMGRSLNAGRLPQTFVAMEGATPLGMYQLAMADDLTTRPDLYPWLINVYVAPLYRGRRVFRQMMESVPGNARAAGLTELWLYTEHEGLYEKFGWEFCGTAERFRPVRETVRLYRLNICGAAGETVPCEI
ncbi:MAG: GNAT family N-acetyltransferase [Clostridia bacterium]|nr:GNAT family N-acetyltransferase [Clostridia bacterium]